MCFKSYIRQYCIACLKKPKCTHIPFSSVQIEACMQFCSSQNESHQNSGRLKYCEWMNVTCIRTYVIGYSFLCTINVSSCACVLLKEPWFLKNYLNHSPWLFHDEAKISWFQMSNAYTDFTTVYLQMVIIVNRSGGQKSQSLLRFHDLIVAFLRNSASSTFSLQYRPKRKPKLYINIVIFTYHQMPMTLQHSCAVSIATQ